ncbi:MAG TPA: four helix bundle protein [Gemmataceae bacterium]|nr:four helix bundle protein [Gemmataceae bacterium]
MDHEIKSFKDLIVWRKAMDLAKMVYQVTKAFPSDERFGLTAQVRRAVVSVSSNIAEGHARRGQEFVRFLSIARGSLAEVESQLLLATELGFLTESDITEALSLMTEIRRMASALTRKLS